MESNIPYIKLVDSLPNIGKTVEIQFTNGYTAQRCMMIPNINFPSTSSEPVCFILWIINLVKQKNLGR